MKVYATAWYHRDDELPAADDKKDEGRSPKQSIDTEIVPQTLIRELLIVLGPKLDPDSWK
jgi:hypothetical protein